MPIDIKFILFIYLSHVQYINIKSLFVFDILAGVSVCQLPNWSCICTLHWGIITVPLILDNTQKPSQVHRYIKGNACSLVVFCIIVGKVVKINQQ